MPNCSVINIRLCNAYLPSLNLVIWCDRFILPTLWRRYTNHKSVSLSKQGSNICCEALIKQRPCSVHNLICIGLYKVDRHKMKTKQQWSIRMCMNITIYFELWGVASCDRDDEVQRASLSRSFKRPWWYPGRLSLMRLVRRHEMVMMFPALFPLELFPTYVVSSYPWWHVVGYIPCRPYSLLSSQQFHPKQFHPKSKPVVLHILH